VLGVDHDQRVLFGVESDLGIIGVLRLLWRSARNSSMTWYSHVSGTIRVLQA
jgi:hypothetical protein